MICDECGIDSSSILMHLSRCYIFRDIERASHVIMASMPLHSLAQFCSHDVGGDCGPPVHLQCLQKSVPSRIFQQ